MVEISAWKMVLILALTIAGWELLRLALKQLFSLEYYRRESDEVVIRVKVLAWDKKGKKHFEEQGYTREYPEQKA